MKANDKYKKLYQDDYDELLIKMATANYIDELGQCIEQKRKELMNLPEYQIPKESYTQFQKSLTHLKSQRRRQSLYAYFYTMPRKIAVFICIILLGLVISVTSVNAFKLQFINFLIHTTESYTNITLNEHQSLSAPKLPSEWDGQFYPHYIPKGFEVTKATLKNNTGQIIYKDESNNTILFSMNTDLQDLYVDTENTIYKTVTINDSPAKLFIKDGLHTIVFNNTHSVFIVSGNISDAELLLIAEHVQN